MQVKREQLTPTRVKLSIVADETLLTNIKEAVLKQLGSNVKVPGFRPGKAPAHLIEKNLDPNVLQTEVIDQAINRLYVDAAVKENLRPVARPEINLMKFVPFSELEFTAETEAVGKITLPDYRKMKHPFAKPTVSAKDVDEVIAMLRGRAATKNEVKRAAKMGDEVVIDFAGIDPKTKEAIDGATGKAYALTLGSKSFIPGFEEEVVGMKAGDEKTFNITFPKDYGAQHLQSKKVEFTVTAHTVNELTEPKLDDDFASKIGPFKTLAELKSDIKKQLQAEREQEALRAYDDQVLQAIVEKAKIDLPALLVEEEVERIEAEERQNTLYRGQTWEEHLKAEGVTDEEHRAKNRPGAELRVKAGLVLGEVVEQEKIKVTPEELDVRIQLLKGQYRDDAMQAELDKPENRRDIMNRMLTEKALDLLRSLAQKA